MISFNSKSINFSINKNDLEAEKAKLLIQLWQQKNNGDNKINSNEIENIARTNLMKAKVDNFVSEAKKEAGENVFLMPPHVKLSKDDENETVYTIELVYYSFAEFKKVRLDNLSISFEYKELPIESLEETYNKVINNYPMLVPTENACETGDCVKVDATVIKDDKVVLNDKNKIIYAEGTSKFTVNSLVIGHKAGEYFETTAPDTAVIKIKIHEILKTTPTNLTDENIKDIKLENINSLEDLKNKIYSDARKENASNQLIQYYQKAFQSISIANSFSLPENYIVIDADDMIQREIMQINPAHRDAFVESLNKNDEQGKAVKNQCWQKAVNSYFNYLIENIVYHNGGLKITPEELTNEQLFARDVIGYSLNNEEQMKQVKVVLIRKKIALYLLKQNNKDIYEKMSKDLQLTV
ncbi:trigger factor-related chaperone [Mycoplasmopsis felifaucium]|uniref:Trigger factor n=1 Tax=Mycoplasmopsis felifaucium TaxID=35768 RepID=A0ABZ2RQ95_9BACT